jgi:hypothetical protein
LTANAGILSDDCPLAPAIGAILDRQKKEKYLPFQKLQGRRR